jgi:hypothetical protein
MFPNLPRYYYKTTSTTVSYALDLDGVIQIGYQPAAGGSAESVTLDPEWFIDTAVPDGLALVTNGLAFTFGGLPHFSRDGALFRTWNPVTGAAVAAGSAESGGRINLSSVPAGGANTVVWSNAAHDARGGLDVFGGIYRTANAPLAEGNFQQQAGAVVSSADDAGVITGGFTGLVDYSRGIVAWSVAGAGPLDGQGTAVRADEVTYNAVFEQYVPQNEALLGISTTRLPIDGKVPIYRAGDIDVVFNTLTTTLPNPLTKGLAYSLGRERIAAVVVRTAAGVKVPGALYTMNFNAGEITFPVLSDLTGYDQPFTVHHRIEDELTCNRVDISGRLDLAGALTHDYPAGTSFVASKVRKGDLFARAYGYFEQQAWNNVWADTPAGDPIVAQYNHIDFPWTVTNRGAIEEDWAVIFMTTTTVRVIGRHVGQLLTGVSITEVIEPMNPNTDAPYFSIPVLGWGSGWVPGNVLRGKTAACGAPVWEALTVLQGPRTVTNDRSVVAFRTDVDTP